jgi:hypothetical protein
LRRVIRTSCAGCVDRVLCGLSRSSDRGSSCRTTINPIQTAREARPQRESHHARHT